MTDVRRVEYPYHSCTPVILPQGAKPFTRPLVRGIGTSIRVELLEANEWPMHRHVTHWQAAIVFEPAHGRLTWRRTNGSLMQKPMEGGQVWILPPGRMHGVRMGTKAHAVVLYLEAESVKEYFPKIGVRDSLGRLQDYAAANPDIAELCAKLRILSVQRSMLSDWQIAATGTQLAILLFDAHTRLSSPESDKPTATNQRIVDQAKAYITSNLKGGPLGEEFARSLGVSGRHFRRLFLQATGKSLKEYVAFVRTQQAIRLLRAGTHTVKEAAEAAGFSDNSYLHRCTRKFYGVPPSAFRPRRIWPSGT